MAAIGKLLIWKDVKASMPGVSKQPLTNDALLYDAAFAGDLDQCQSLITTGGAHVDVALIGASDYLYTTATAPSEDAEKRKAICRWCLERGACWIFSFNHEDPLAHCPRGLKYNKPVSMLKGPGDVPKGTFGKQMAEGTV